MRKAAKTEEQDGIVGRRHTPAQARGNAAESLAESFLAARGCRTIARQFRCKAGEIDLICLSGQTIVFVEVRIRTNPRFGSAAESVTATKRQRIVRAAQWWLAGPGRLHAQRSCRFDVVAMDGLQPDAMQWFPGAFDAG
jgi:putative endonuclease